MNEHDPIPPSSAAQETSNSSQDVVDRRAFLRTTAVTAVGVGVGTLTASSAQARPKVSKVSTGPYPALSMAAFGASGALRQHALQRRALGPNDVAIKLQYCGICHSDIHTARGDWGQVAYPLVTGHELAGEVVAIGASVSKHSLGARVGVGCMVDSSGHCAECTVGLEQYCEAGNTQTYGSKDRDGTITQGGYSTFVVVKEDFFLSVPDAIELADAGPLMCAGVTVYSPFRRWGIGPGKKVGVIGLGGLGHMAVKIGRAMGAEVTVFTTSPDKVADAKRFGASTAVVMSDGVDLSRFTRKLDFILDTSPYRHPIDPFIPLLRRDGVLCIVGVGKVSEPNQWGPLNLVLARNMIAGSAIGGIRETQELVDFCALHNIRPEIKKVGMAQIDEAWLQVVAKQARYRYVIDVNAERV